MKQSLARTRELSKPSSSRKLSMLRRSWMVYHLHLSRQAENLWETDKVEGGQEAPPWQQLADPPLSWGIRPLQWTKQCSPLLASKLDWQITASWCWSVQVPEGTLAGRPCWGNLGVKTLRQTWRISQCSPYSSWSWWRGWSLRRSWRTYLLKPASILWILSMLWNGIQMPAV